MREGTTITGHTEWCRSVWLVDPSSSPANPPRPRVPTTIISTAVENSVSSAAPEPSSACRFTTTSRPATAESTTASSPARTSARTASRSTGAGIHAAIPDPPARGTATTAVSSAPHKSASSIARSSATRAESEPSIPTTIRVIGRRTSCSSRTGTTTVGQCACAGSAEETVPRRRSAKPPLPRVPTTASPAFRESSTRTPAASPTSSEEVISRPSRCNRATAWSSTAWAPARIAESSSAAYPPSIDATVKEGML